MSQYEVGQQWFFPQLGRKPDAGEIVELDDDVAANYMRNEPGLLKPVKKTTQATVPVKRTRRLRTK
jgi:hypothetical protein